MVTRGQSEPWHIQRDIIYPNIPKHKCCTDVHDFCMRINGAPGKLAAHRVLCLSHDLICLEWIGWREGWRDQQAGYRGGLEIGVGGHGYQDSMCTCVCLWMFVCVLKRWNEALQQPWPSGAGKVMDQRSPGSSHTHLNFPRNLCHLSTLPPTLLQFISEWSWR